ncbi:MAG: iron-containing alcohol dehydrogenase, partial [Proteobacteria bacterium]|nr:iron-containing alcohol dehydrogenase [Pseudomonadota bacterium]
MNLRIREIGHVLVVTDKMLMELKLLDSFLASLEQNGVKYTVFDGVQPNPTIENVENGRRVYREQRCDGIVGFGGGSPIDCAKVIAARIGNPFLSVRRMKGLFKVILPIPPFFCVPTTAGTGTETPARLAPAASQRSHGGLLRGCARLV